MYALACRTDLPDKVAALQQSLGQLHAWGRKWRIRFEPAKSQLLVLSKAPRQPLLPPITFGGTTIAVAEHLRLLGVTFDSKLSFHRHLQQVAARTKQRLGFLRRATRILDVHGRQDTYKGFIRPVLEYAPLVWMGAAKTHLSRLDRVQRNALHVLGPGILLQSLQARRTVAALAYLYKLQHISGPPQLRAIVPPSATPIENGRPTRSNHALHGYQLQLPSRHSPEYTRRSFPFSVIAEWNALPVDLLPVRPCSKGLQTFKEKVCRQLSLRNWRWATDSL